MVGGVKLVGSDYGHSLTALLNEAAFHYGFLLDGGHEPFLGMYVANAHYSPVGIHILQRPVGHYPGCYLRRTYYRTTKHCHINVLLRGKFGGHQQTNSDESFRTGFQEYFGLEPIAETDFKSMEQAATTFPCCDTPP